ncbi:zinc-binding dehydrogenase [Streptomyces tendae]
MSTWVGRRTASSAPVRAVAPEGVHAAADLVGTEEAVDVSVELVPDRSRIASIAGHERGNQAPGWCAGRGSPHRDPPSRPPAQLTRAATADRLRIVIAGSYPLREAATAHREIMAGHTTGKIVLVP